MDTLAWSRDMRYSSDTNLTANSSDSYVFKTYRSLILVQLYNSIINYDCEILSATITRWCCSSTHVLICAPPCYTLQVRKPQPRYTAFWPFERYFELFKPVVIWQAPLYVYVLWLQVYIMFRWSDLSDIFLIKEGNSQSFLLYSKSSFPS